MVILVPPGDEALVVRRAKSSYSSAGKWHFIRDTQSRKCLCGELIVTYYDVEYSILKKAKPADLCAKCWPFDKKDIAPKDAQMDLFTITHESTPARAD